MKYVGLHSQTIILENIKLKNIYKKKKKKKIIIANNSPIHLKKKIFVLKSYANIVWPF